MTEIVAPIIIDNRHPQEELAFFDSVEAVEAHLEPWYAEEESFAAYDSTGRLLALAVVEGRVVVTPAEVQATHATDLRSALASFIENKRRPGGTRPLEQTELPDLLAEAMRLGWVVR